MTLREIYSANKTKNDGSFAQKTPVISFEIFPPKNDENGEKLEKLLHHLSVLKKYDPAFVSLTYGAGGTNQSSALNIVKRLQDDLDFNVMPHFTCVCSERAHIKDYLKEIEGLGIKNILALRGDIPEGVVEADFDFHYANELVDFIKAETNLSIGVAGYPEGHIECEDLTLDLKNLKRKVDSGADAIFTQMFFDNDKFFSFYESAKKAGIEVPIIPGILPITSYGQIDRMLSMGRVTMPHRIKSRLEKFKDNPEDVKKTGIEFATTQCQQLVDAEISGLHFYTLNSSYASSEILDNLAVVYIKKY